MLDQQFSIAICGKYNRDANYGEPALEVPSDWYQIYIYSVARSRKCRYTQVFMTFPTM